MLHLVFLQGVFEGADGDCGKEGGALPSQPPWLLLLLSKAVSQEKMPSPQVSGITLLDHIPVCFPF